MHPFLICSHRVCFLIGILTSFFLLFIPLSVQGAQGVSVTLAWDPNPEAYVAGYRVYYGSASGSYSSMVDVGNWTSLTISGLGAGKTYYFAATAYDTAGDESAKSDELRYDTPSPASNFLSPANGSYDTTNYTINASAGPNGSISSSGNVVVRRGSNKTFIIRPNRGYRIGRVNIDGVCINYITSHTFAHINANHTIRAEFEPIWNIYRKKMTPSN